MKYPANDVLEPIKDDVSFLEGHAGDIIDFQRISVLADNVEFPSASNDLGHLVKLDASDVLDLGNNIIITGHDTDSIEFEDAGWTKFSSTDSLPDGIIPQEGFDIYMHESGAIVQIEDIIMTNYPDPGSV